MFKIYTVRERKGKVHKTQMTKNKETVHKYTSGNMIISLL